MATIRIPNPAQDQDKGYLAQRLTPFPPNQVAAEMDVIHGERGRGANCGCAECVEQYGDTMETEDFPEAMQLN